MWYISYCLGLFVCSVFREARRRFGLGVGVGVGGEWEGGWGVERPGKD